MMARPLYASFLPTIKCSSCGVEIEISAMGDHLCTGPTDDSNIHSARTDHDRIAPSTLNVPIESGSLGLPTFAPLQNPAPPTPQDTDRTRRPSEPLQTSAASVYSVSASSDSSLLRPSEARPGAGIRKPSSEMALPQDSPFPVFPTRKSIARNKVPNKLELESNDSTSNAAPPLPSAPLNGQSSSGATVLRRMNTIAPGPFHSRAKKEVDKAVSRSPTTSTPPSLDNEEELAATQPPQRPPRPKTDDSLVEKLQSSAHGDLQAHVAAPQLPPLPNLPLDVVKFDSIPTTDVDSSASNDVANPSPLSFNQQGSTPPTHRPNSITESVSSTGSPSISEYRSTSSRSSESPIVSKGSSEFRQKISVDQNTYGDQTIESVLDQAPAKEQSAPLEDTRSNSPEINQSEREPVKEPSQVPSAVQKVDTGIAARLDGPGVMQESPIVWSSPTSDQFADGEQRLSSLRYDPTAANGKAVGPEMDLCQKASIRKPRPKVKGDCRGCGTPIVGKSLKAADGKLSGRWHKECFVCKTCKSKFQSADFYVLNDQPYCARHYHEVNRSLCHQCNAGIEGKYLQMQTAQKYHVDCFTCHDCRKPLTRDYFEMNTFFYCEADAYRTWQKSKMLTPGRRFPERRTTKLMNMS